jgi:UPF0716 protein FxsA
MWLLILLIAVPIIEIALFIEVGGWLGLWPTLGIVVLTAVLGTVLLRAQGLGALRKLQSSLDGGGEDPRGVIAHGAMILVAGVLLLTPGFFTDAVGFLLLTPPFRTFVIAKMAARMAVHVQTFSRTETHRETRGPTIDGEYKDVTPEKDRKRDGGRDGEHGGPPSGWTRLGD